MALFSPQNPGRKSSKGAICLSGLIRQRHQSNLEIGLQRRQNSYRKSPLSPGPPESWQCLFLETAVRFQPLCHSMQCQGPLSSSQSLSALLSKVSCPLTSSVTYTKQARGKRKPPFKMLGSCLYIQSQFVQPICNLAKHQATGCMFSFPTSTWLLRKLQAWTPSPPLLFLFLPS